MRGGKKEKRKEKKVSHPVTNRLPNDRKECTLPIAQHKALQQARGNLCYI